MTPQILVDAGVAGVVVPAEAVRDGRMVLTVHTRAVQGLAMGNDEWRFSTRFNGRAVAVRIPVTAVAAIFCRENGHGIAFQTAGGLSADLPGNRTAQPENQAANQPINPTGNPYNPPSGMPSKRPRLSSVKPPADAPRKPYKPTNKRKPHLTLVK